MQGHRAHGATAPEQLPSGITLISTPGQFCLHRDALHQSSHFPSVSPGRQVLSCTAPIPTWGGQTSAPTMEAVAVAAVLHQDTLLAGPVGASPGPGWMARAERLPPTAD